jgi:hypothetical protein
MTTMIDEIFDRQYQSGRAQLNAGIGHLFGSIGRELGKSMAAIHRFEWNAPWVNSKQSTKKGARLA